MESSNKRVAILVEDLYQDLELWYPFYRLREEGIKPVIVGIKKAHKYKGKYGYPVESDIDIKEAKIDEFDAVLIPGGFAPDLMRKNRDMIDFVKDMNTAGKLVASICHGAWMLASAGIIQGKKCTCYDAIADDIINAGGIYSDEEVVVDGNIITSRKPDDLPAFCQAIISKLI
ncbi:MAG: type 1 glutamine amidotransferase domain-containing protein [bacterium]|nr:type 1 glutamine amidotransferase domain-containing protein [bacterium]